MSNTFYIKPYPRSRYRAEVVICDTLKEMRKIAKRRGYTNKRALGWCFWVSSGRTFARILLPKNFIGSGLVSHELHHAKDNYMLRTQKRQAGLFDREYYVGNNHTKPYERNAYVMGNLVNSFWVEFYKRYEIKYV